MRKRIAAGLGCFIVSCLALSLSAHYAHGQNAKPLLTLSSDKLRADPQLFSGSLLQKRQLSHFTIKDQTISKADFETVTLSLFSLDNVTFVDCSFSAVLLQGGEFKNVTFKNCNFFEIQFSHITFDNVAFTGGKIEMLYDDRDDPRRLFEELAFYSIKNRNLFLLDGVSLRESNFLGIEGGSLILRNMSDFNFNPQYSRLLSGKNLTLGIENCSIAGIDTIADLKAGSNVYIKDSYLLGGKILGHTENDEKPPNFYAENSYLAYGFWVGGMGSLLARDCVLGASLRGNDIFLVAPQLAADPRSSVYGDNVYIWGNKAAFDFLEAGSDNRLDIYDLNITTLEVGGSIKALNLRNLKLDNLYFDGGINLQGGNWENVAVKSPLRVNSPGVYHFGSINLHNTVLPAGGYVEDKRISSGKEVFKLETRESSEPLAWEETAVPDLRQLGINF